YTGIWFQNVTLAVLVLEAGFGGWGLAAISVAQFGPVLFMAAPAGALSDRFSPRTILAIAAFIQLVAAMALIALVAFALDANAWIIAAITLSGIGSATDRVAAPA